MALGFGHVANATVLGQPLSFTVPLRFDADEYVGDECVAVEVWSGDNKLPPSSVQHRIDSAADGRTPVLRVTTSSLIDEPIATLSVALGCPVRLTRKFVLFVDPPIVALAQAAPAEAPVTPAEPAASAPPRAAEVAAPRPRRAASALAARAPSTSSEARARPRAVTRAPSQRHVQANTARRRSEARVRAAAAPASAGGPRLQLEPAQALQRPAPAASVAAAASAAPPAAAAASAISVAAAASVPDAAASAAAGGLDAGRLRQLEGDLSRLAADNAATRKEVAALQSRLREAESGRYVNPLVYTLAGLAVLLLLALLGVIAWARRRERERAEWWDHPMPSVAPALQEAEESRPAVARGAAIAPPAAESVAAASWRHTVEIPELEAGEAPRRAVSAEELIDLEQQAEFFVTLGQDDAAVELLLNHIASVGGISPLPYLKLLEIHRHRGDREAYERVREQFNQRFNAYAPGWDDHAAPAHSLEDDREVMARLQAAWPTPARAMGVLEPLLFRQGAGDAVFDLAAYREVLFLYEIARDLADRESKPASVDLELPLGDSPSVVSYPLHNTMPITPAAGVARPLALDVNLDDGAEEPEKPSERSERYEGGDFSFSSPAPLGTPRKPNPR